MRELLHVGYWASAWADRVGLLARAPALRARADIEVCAAAEDAASQQGSSAEKTRLPALLNRVQYQHSGPASHDRGEPRKPPVKHAAGRVLKDGF